MSVNEISKDYIKSLVMKELNIQDEKEFNLVMPNFNYKDYIPFSTIMVDVDYKKNTDKVKNNIENKIENAKAIIKASSTSSYVAYQGEIDEGKTYVGVFSGIFLFIAMLATLTTMTRVVKKERIQIGTLKVLGFKDKQIENIFIKQNNWIAITSIIIGLPAGFYLTDWLFKTAIEEHYDFCGYITIKTYIFSAIGTLLVSYLVSNF